MPKLTVKSLNQQLKGALCRVRVEQINNKLYLRGTLPPKPGKGTNWYQQRIPLGCNATSVGLKRARTLAFAASANLDQNRFDWADWVNEPSPERSVADAVQAFERAYFERRQRTGTTEKTFRHHYMTHFHRLPQDKPVTRDLLIRTLTEQTEPDSHARKGAYIAYRALYKTIFGKEMGRTDLKGAPKSEAVDSKDLPSDKHIEEMKKQLEDNPDMVACYCLIAIYGLRPSECFWVDADSLLDPDGIIRVLTHKAKHPYWRLVYPSRTDWVQDWNIANLTLPKSSSNNNKDRGMRVNKFFKRRSIDFNPYMLRHAYAARLAKKNVDSAIAARWMGHSNYIHTRIYHKFLDREQFDRVFEQYVKMSPDAD